jgi:hypothetical protein
MTSRALRPSLLLLFLAIPFSLFAEEPKLHILWDTVSPDGRYAIGTDAPDQLSYWVIAVATSNKAFDLPDLQLASEPNSLNTVWSEDSRHLLILLNQHFSRHNTTIAVILADTVTRKAVDLTDQISDEIKKKVTKHYGGSFFMNPWFVAADRFSLVGDAGPRDYDFYFAFGKGGEKLQLAKALPTDNGTESTDRALNRAYRKLHGLLSADEQTALVEEQRVWLAKRDAIKSEKKKEEFITERFNELQDRADKIIQQRRQ